MTCKFCLRLDQDCECTFHCADCDRVMIKDEINGGHLCPTCDASMEFSDFYGDLLNGSDDLRQEWAGETWRVRLEG